MGNRYTNEGRDPRDLYDDSGRRLREERVRGNRPRYTDADDRSYPPFRDRGAFGGGENYFGSRQSYGMGLENTEPNHSFGYSWRDSTGNSNYDDPDRRYESTERRACFGRDAYGLGYGGDWEPEANRRRYEARDRSRQGYAQPSRSYRDYPSSESGFEPNRGDDRSWWERASDEVSSWFGGDDRDQRYYDARSRGHRGRGPKGYTRSDERIREDINDRLTDYDYIDASDIEVNVENGEVILTGLVENRYEKRMAEDIVEDVSGVRNVENRIRIKRDQEQYSESGNVTQTAQDNDTEQTQSRTATNRT
jgi:osmotically-inducible protein OsmY